MIPFHFITSPCLKSKCFPRENFLRCVCVNVRSSIRYYVDIVLTSHPLLVFSRGRLIRYNSTSVRCKVNVERLFDLARLLRASTRSVKSEVRLNVLFGFLSHRLAWQSGKWKPKIPKCTSSLVLAHMTRCKKTIIPIPKSKPIALYAVEDLCRIVVFFRYD